MEQFTLFKYNTVCPLQTGNNIIVHFA